MKVPCFSHLSDSDLTREGPRLISDERTATAAVVSWLLEFDKRRLYLGLGFSSLFTYCRGALHLGEGAAYRRIEAARAARRFPVVLAFLADGRLSLTAISLLSQHLTAANHESLLASAVHKSTRDVEIMVAGLAPKPDARTFVRRLPERRAPQDSPVKSSESSPPPVACALPPVSPPPRPVIAPLAPERFKLQITMSQETHDTLRQLQNLMRHSVPNGDVAVIVERALQVLLRELMRKKCGMRKRDLPASDPQAPEKGGHRPLLH